MKKVLVFVLISLFLATSITGCATSRRGQEQQKGTAVGAGVGAGIGFLVGALLGDGAGKLVGTAIGAAVGGAAGYMIATDRFDKIESASNKANALDEAIAENTKSIAQQNAYVSSLQKERERLDQQTALLSQAIANKTAKKEVLTSSLETIKDQIAKSTAQRDAYAQELAYLEGSALQTTKKYGDQKQVGTLQSQIAQVRSNISKIEAEIDTFASFSQRLTTG